MAPPNIHGQVLRLVALPRAARKALVATLDSIVCVVAVWVALWLRLGEWELTTPRALIFTGLALGTWVAVAAAIEVLRRAPGPCVRTSPHLQITQGRAIVATPFFLALSEA